MEQNNPILFQHVIDEKGAFFDEIGREIRPGDKITWTHVNVENKEAEAWVQEKFSHLDEFTRRSFLEKETRPRLVEIDKGLYLTLRGVNLNEDADPEDMVSVRIWVEKGRVYTFYRRNLKAISDLEALFKKGKIKDIGSFLTYLIDCLFTRMQSFLSKLDESIDDIEEGIEESDLSIRDQIVTLRRQAIMIKRYLSPQRDVISRLKAIGDQWFSKKNMRHLTESHDRIFRFIEDLDMIRERAQIVKDEIATLMADRLNRNMYVLSVIASIFLPLGFLTGLLGVNLSGIPNAENESSFLIFCGILITVVALQTLIFKKLKWF